MVQLIHSRLIEIEAENAIKIVYAFESGSRAWGFPSANSDYDVRFIYIRPVDWYLSVVEIADENDVDQAFQQGQALGLPMIRGEWINTDVYHCHQSHRSGTGSSRRDLRSLRRAGVIDIIIFSHAKVWAVSKTTINTYRPCDNIFMAYSQITNEKVT